MADPTCNWSLSMEGGQKFGGTDGFRLCWIQELRQCHWESLYLSSLLSLVLASSSGRLYPDSDRDSIQQLQAHIPHRCRSKRKWISLSPYFNHYSVWLTHLGSHTHPWVIPDSDRPGLSCISSFRGVEERCSPKDKLGCCYQNMVP